ncbi:MAG TPA: serine/threonine-protein kinase [Kofleriaceae bacterium]|jgi:serine/threonine-protein kinase
MRVRSLFDSRYEILHPIGVGGMAEVYAARDQHLGRSVAIKILRGDCTPETAAPERMRREAMALAMIDSPHVVSIHDLGETPEGPYLVLQLVHGMTVAEEVERFGPMATDRACRLALDVLAGLAAMHGNGLVHRDLKPTNIMLDRDDRAVLLDLGVALHRRRRPLTPPGMCAGTLEHMAPEHREGMLLDARSDLYQLGLVIAFVVTGAMHDAQLGELPTSIRANIPSELQTIVDRALAPVAERYATAFSMQRDLESIIDSYAPRTNRPEVRTQRPRWPWSILRGGAAGTV